MRLTTQRKWSALGVLALLTLSMTQANAETKLIINAFLPGPHVMNVKVLKPWADDVAKATNGRVKIEVPPASVAAPDQLWNSVRNGVVDGAYLFNGTVQGQLKLMQMPQLPFLGTHARENSVALWRTYEKFFRPANEYKDVHLLSTVVFPAGIMYSMDKPISSVQDLQGTKVWALPGVPAKLMTMAKAGVVSTPAAKMSEIVAGGTVNAFVGIPDMDAEGFKVISYAKSATTVPGGLTTPAFSFIMNRQKWGSLSQQDRDIITKLSGEAFAERMEAFDQVEASAHAAAMKAGLAYKEASPQLLEELQKGATTLTNEWLAISKSAKVNGAEALTYYRSQSTGSSK